MKKDRILKVGKSPLDDDLYWAQEDKSDQNVGLMSGEVRLDKGVLSVSGKMSVGTGGHSVTVIVIDEVTGEELEMNNVSNALLIVEDKRKTSSGWLSVLVGDVEKVGGVLRFIARATMDELKKLTKTKSR